jgi:integrase
MTTEEQPQKQQKNNAWTPPRGIRYALRPGLPKPFLLHWRGADGVRKCTSFPDEKMRERAAKTLAEKRLAHGRTIMNFNPREWALWEKFRAVIGDADPLEVARFWIARGGSTQAKPTLTVGELVKAYLAARETDGVGKASLSHTRGDLARLVEKFGSTPADRVTADQLRAWLAALPFAPTTKRNHHKNGAAAWNWAMREELCSANPWRNVEKPPMTTDEVCVLSVPDAVKFFTTARQHRPEACAKFALEAFCGLRASTAARVEKSEIDFAAGGIRIPAAKIKTARPQYIDGLPENLWAWLRATSEESWALTGKDYERAKSDVFRLAGVVNPGNVLRHSFCSYHVAQYRDAARTAVILCHTSPRTLYRHYKGIATAADAAAYFSILPA